MKLDIFTADKTNIHEEPDKYQINGDMIWLYRKTGGDEHKGIETLERIEPYAVYKFFSVRIDD